jgi:hypothetical protein
MQSRSLKELLAFFQTLTRAQEPLAYRRMDLDDPEVGAPAPRLPTGRTGDGALRRYA